MPVTASQAVTASATNYVYLRNSGTLTVNITGWPSAPTLYVPLAVVVAGSAAITSVTDAQSARLSSASASCRWAAAR